MVCADHGQVRARRVYGRELLLSLYSPCSPPSPDIIKRIRDLGLWTVCRLKCARRRLRLRCYRGNRAGRRVRRQPAARDVGNGAVVIISTRPAPRPVVGRPPSTLRRVRVDRHSSPARRSVVFGSINIRSIANKLDDLPEVRRDLLIDVLFVVETWHDVDSVAFRRLRADGFQAIDRPRPRLPSCADTLRPTTAALLLSVWLEYS
jgi:hypothetical protein